MSTQLIPDSLCCVAAGLGPIYLTATPKLDTMSPAHITSVVDVHAYDDMVQYIRSRDATWILIKGYSRTEQH